jgi:D-glucosaminate-6-phosphate ammonia-lyase
VSDSIYARLGVRPVINGVGTYTLIGGSIMPPEVVRAMAEAARQFVSIGELQAAVGARIAGLLDVPAAMVTAGAASAITVGTAACMTLGDEPALGRLPETTGLRNEVVLQKSHESGYEAQMRAAGARLVWVETRGELDRAINDRTAMLFFLNRHDPLGEIKRAEWIGVGKERGVPTFSDAAADVPPVEHLSRYVREGFDLVAFSGGKALRGPQSTGLLLGRADLIARARQAISPHDGIGRAMKVGKEEIVGLLAAVELYLETDHAAEERLWEGRAAEMIGRLSKIPGLSAHCDVPEIANHTPHVVLRWDRILADLTADQVKERLWEGSPPIAVLVEGERAIRIAVWTLKGDEYRVVTDRLAALFQ